MNPTIEALLIVAGGVFLGNAVWDVIKARWIKVGDTPPPKKEEDATN